VASYQALGEYDKAKELTAEMMAAWPDFPFDTLIKRIFRKSENAEEVLVQLRAAGWKEADRSQ
jgi:DNA-binding SARP family transcriptional activator